MQRFILLLLKSLALTLFILAIAWPILALIGRCLTDGASPRTGFTFTARQLTLLWRSLWMAGTATAAATILSLPASLWIGRTRSLLSRPLLLALFVAVLLIPPMMCEFGWSRVLTSRWPGELRCLLAWTLWIWPIPAMLIGTGWRRQASEVFEAALLTTSPWRAFFYAALPSLMPFLTASMLIVFVILFNDYSVPHACGVFVYATELLSWSVSSSYVVDTLWPSIPSVGITLMALLGIWIITGRFTHENPTTRTYSRTRKLDVMTISLPWLLCLLSVGLPIGALVVKLFTWAAMRETLILYRQDLLWSIVVAGGAGLLVALMGRGLISCSRAWPIFLTLAVVFGAVPGAVVGEALVAGYDFSNARWIYDHWPISMLANVSRFVWLGLMVFAALKRTGSTLLTAQALTDGADNSRAVDLIQFGASVPVLLAAGGVATALSLGEVPAATIVRNPDFAPLSLLLIEKYHRFEDGALVSLCLWLAVVALLAALLVGFCSGWPRRYEPGK